MTVDELVDLTQALLDAHGFHLASLRDIGAPGNLDELTDEQFLLAVRFVAGERPQVGIDVSALREPGPISRRLKPIDDDEYAERLARLEELEEETPAGPVDIGDGVTLGL